MKNSNIKHFDNRETPIDTLVYHCSALDIDEMLNVLDEYKLSCHYIIGLNGEVVQVVDEDNRAWHTRSDGVWRGINSLNSHSIGIELSSLSLGQEPYSDKQIASLIELSQDIIKRHNISPLNIIGHSDAEPTRKPDPGKAFPWEYLSSQGIGLWYNLENADKVKENNPQTLLSIIGYNTSSKEATIASSYAFCRRFLPDKVATHDDIMHLIHNVYSKDFDCVFTDVKFIKTLKAVAYSFGNFV